MQRILKSGTGEVPAPLLPMVLSPHRRQRFLVQKKRGGRESHDLPLFLYFNGLLPSLQAPDSIPYTLTQTGLRWPPIPICEYFQVARRVCQGLGRPRMLLAGFRMSLNAALEAQLGFRENPRKRFCSQPLHSLTGPLLTVTRQTCNLCFFSLMRKSKTAHSTPFRLSFEQNLLETGTIVN